MQLELDFLKINKPVKGMHYSDFITGVYKGVLRHKSEVRKTRFTHDIITVTHTLKWHFALC